jgi:hypothetical protein
VRLLWLKVYAAPVEESAPEPSHRWIAPDDDAAETELPAPSREGEASRVASRTAWADAPAPRRVAPWLRAAPVVELPEPTIPDLLAPTRLEAS